MVSTRNRNGGNRVNEKAKTMVYIGPTMKHVAREEVHTEAGIHQNLNRR